MLKHVWDAFTYRLNHYAFNSYVVTVIFEDQILEISNFRNAEPSLTNFEPPGTFRQNDGSVSRPKLHFLSYLVMPWPWPLTFKFPMWGETNVKGITFGASDTAVCVKWPCLEAFKMEITQEPGFCVSAPLVCKLYQPGWNACRAHWWYLQFVLIKAWTFALGRWNIYTGLEDKKSLGWFTFNYLCH